MDQNSFQKGVFFWLEAPRSGAFKANALPGGPRRLAVRAVKSAVCAFIGAQRKLLTEEADGLGAAFRQEGQNEGGSARGEKQANLVKPAQQTHGIQVKWRKSILCILEWPIERSRVSARALSGLTLYSSWRADRDSVLRAK